METVVSVILLCLTVILGSSQLKPVKWREWTNEQEREAPGSVLHMSFALTSRATNILEHRPGFLDIRARRKAFLAKKEEKKAVM